KPPAAIGAARSRFAGCPPLAHTHIGVEITAIGSRCDKSGANGEIADPLALVPVGGIGSEHRVERGDDAGVIKILCVELGQARAVEGSAEIHVVTAWPFPDQADLGEVRPRAAVRAAGHAYENVVGR